MSTFYKNIICVLWIMNICPYIFGGMIFGENTQKINDPETIIYYYLDFSDSLIGEFDLDQAKIYLDSASMYLKKINDPAILGFYHQISGDYYTYRRDEPKAHENYYKAINYYEKSGRNDQLNPIYFNLAFSYIQKCDTEILKDIINKMYSLALKQKSNTSILEVYEIMAFYYNCLHEKNGEKTEFLDSVIFYETKVTSIFETVSNPKIEKDDIASNYIMLANALITKGELNADSVNYYIERAKYWSNLSDTSMIVNCYWVEGELAFRTGNLETAENTFIQLFELMDNWMDKSNLSLFVDICSRLSEIFETKGNYANALYFEHKKIISLNEIHDAEKYKIINELREVYESDKKDREILFRKKLSWLYFGICILSFLSFFFVFRWMRSRKEMIISKLQLVQMEKKEIELQSQLKDEKIKTIELEKYEALLDSHFKETEISKKDKVLIDLKKEQEKLNTNIKEYTKKIQKYEQNREEELISDIQDIHFYNYANEVYHLIRKKLSHNENYQDYINALQKLSDRFFVNLGVRYQGDISVLNLKYCISFVIEIDNEMVAECFCVELRSVHMVRHRLRKKLNIDHQTDLNIFLKQLL